MIPRFKPTYSYQELFKALKHTLLGTDLNNKLKAALADFYHVKNVFLFSKAREALFTLLHAYNNQGDVFLPAYNCIVVPEAIKLAGYQPAFLDIDLKTLHFQLDELANKISSRSKAILITHQFGIPAEIDLFLELCKKHKLLIIEDSAPAFGASYHNHLVGTMGEAAILSFDKTKVLSGVGGGALITNNDEIADRVQRCISKQLPPKSMIASFMEGLGYIISTQDNIYPIALSLYRLFRDDNLYEIAPIRIYDPTRYCRALSRFQSSLIFLQFNRIGQILESRRNIASFYFKNLESVKGFILPSVPALSSPSWSQFPILSNNKEETYWKMRKLGVDLSWNYKYSCPESYGMGGFPNSHCAAKSILGLPTYPSLNESACAEICEKISQL